VTYTLLPLQKKSDFVQRRGTQDVRNRDAAKRKKRGIFMFLWGGKSEMQVHLTHVYGAFSLNGCNELTYSYIHKYICMYILYISIHIHNNILVYTYIYKYICIHIRTYIYMYTGIYTYIHVYMYMCIHTRIYTYITYIYTYIYICI